MKTLLFISSLAALSQASVIRTTTLERGPAKVRVSAPRSPLEPVRVSIEAFNEEHTLRLVPAPSPLGGDFKLQTTARDSQGRLVIKDVADDTVVSGLYHDPESDAVVRVDGISVEGLITSKLSVKKTDDGVHEAIRHPDIETSNFRDYLEIPTQFGHYPAEPSTNTKALSVSPEVYVIVDSTIATALGSDQKVKEYLAVFWNAVNLRFATIDDPKINLVLSGALIVRSAEDEPYINNNILHENYINGDNTLDSISKWLYQKKDSLPAHDLVYLMTGKDMFHIENGQFQKTLTGIAWIAGACIEAFPDDKSVNVAMGEDMDEYYSGVMTAAHEVAHNLGSPHDGEDGAEACSWDDGFIMSYISGKPSKLFFSPCSKKLMKDYILSPVAACLQTTQVGEDITQSSKLPGELLSMDEQCRKHTGILEAYVNKTEPEDSLCLNLVCIWITEENPQYTIFQIMGTGRPAAEGSPCRSGGSCTNGSCQ